MSKESRRQRRERTRPQRPEPDIEWDRVVANIGAIIDRIDARKPIRESLNRRVA